MLEGRALDPEVILHTVEATGSSEIRIQRAFFSTTLVQASWISFDTVLRQIDDDPTAVAKASEAARNAFNTSQL